MAVNLSMFAGAGAQFFDNNGVILSGGKIYTYAAGTTTPQTTYTTSAGNVAHTNPIVLNSAGRVASGGEIWLTDVVSYKFVLETAASITIATYDNVTGNGSGIAAGIYATFAAPTGSSLVGFLQTGTEAVATTVQAKLTQIISVKDFGAVGNGVADDTTAIQAAINAATSLSLSGPNNGGGGRGTTPAVFFPSGLYKTSATITTGSSYQLIYGDNAILVKNSAGFTGTYCFASTLQSGWRQIFRNIQIQDYDGGISFDANNINSGNVIVDQCKFFNIQEDALYLETQSGSTIIQNCLWRSCKHDVNNVDGDYVVIRGGWTSRGNSKLTVDGDGGFINHGYMKIVDLEGVPSPFTINECCWVANYGSVVIDNMRFGGETGQCTAVNNFTAGDNSGPYIPNGVVIQNSPTYVGTFPAVRLFEIPNFISLISNSGLAGSGSVWVDWSNTVDATAQATQIANLGALERNLYIISITNCSPNSNGYGVPANLNFLLRDNTRSMSATSDGSGEYAFWNTNNTIVATDKYGTTNYIGRDSSGGASGTRAQVRVEATNTAGAVKYVIASAPASGSSLSDRFVINDLGNTAPGADNTYSLGTASFRWSEVFAAVGAINTSDARMKQQIRDVSEAENRVAQKLKGLLKAFKFNNAVSKKGEDARIHFGVIAQDVKAAFESEGLDAHQYALLCYDEWDAEYKEDYAWVQNQNGEQVKEFTGTQTKIREAGNSYGIRYDELLAFIISAL